MHRHSLLGLSAGLGAAAIWGGMYVVSKVVLQVIPPFALLTGRLLLGIMALGFVYALGRKTSIAGRRFWQIFGVGVIGYGISLGFQFVGTKLSTASNGALVTSATPAFILLFAPSLLGEKITLRKVIALLVSTLGVAAVINPRTAELSPELFWGNLSLLAAALTWALYSVLVRSVTRNTDVVPATGIMLAGGLPSGLALGAWEVTRQGFGPITPEIIAGILFLGIVCTAIAMFLWNYAFAELPAGVASLTFFAQPLVGTILGTLLLDEKIAPNFLAGGVLIGIGLIIASTEKPDQRQGSGPATGAQES